jgi:hypothetical protein
MKTIHSSVASSLTVIGTTVSNALRNHNIRGDFRIIQCGAGLVLLPDTDRKKDATAGEVIKALGFRNKADKMSTENKGERNTFSLSREGEFCTMVSLTPAQVRFLRWCQSEDLFWDEVDFTALGGEVINI